MTCWASVFPTLFPSGCLKVHGHMTFNVSCYQHMTETSLG